MEPIQTGIDWIDRFACMEDTTAPEHSGAIKKKKLRIKGNKGIVNRISALTARDTGSRLSIKGIIECDGGFIWVKF